MDQTQNAFSKINTKEMKNKVQQAVFFIKKKLQEIRKSSANNELAIKVNNKDAQKQITQIEKEIDTNNMNLLNCEKEIITLENNIKSSFF